MHTLGFLKGFDDADHLWSVLTRQRQIAKSLTEFFFEAIPRFENNCFKKSENSTNHVPFMFVAMIPSGNLT
jgi:hypothetical protein